MTYRARRPQLLRAVPVASYLSNSLLIALGVAFAAMLGKVQDMVLGEPNVQPLAHNPALLPVFTHLGLVLMLGLWMPPALADWYRLAARLIG